MSKQEQGNEANAVFDVERVRQLVEMMKTNDLNEISLKQGDQKIRLRRKDEPTQIVMTPQAAPMAGAAPMAAPAPAAAPAAAAPAEAADDFASICSPMVGTFYAKPNPNAEAFVKVGDHVEPDTIVCVVEAMKMFNEIPAGMSGKIVSVLVKNEEAVDVNKPLFKVDPQG